MRLQKFLARAGAASRRGSENLMTAGRVTVNGITVTELGSKVDPRIDEVAVDGIVVQLSDRPVTLALNKPSGVVTTMSDPQGRPCVASLVPTDRYPGLYPIGRLDLDTTGLLLFSTDGELGHALLHPKKHVEKRYIALVEGKPSEKELERLRAGIELDDGMTLPAKVEVLAGEAAKRAFADLTETARQGAPASREYARKLDLRAARRSVVSIRIHEGRKRQVRRMLEAVGHPVVHLHRTHFGPIALGALEPGAWREIDGEELAALSSALRR
ncbi:pseudouridine synthase [Raoultibacter phocaeensis]|uniref:pseudouridine synthase n=1 Tax=Raoultibacter phocaeensis TaxID=2479841 RepID=UPI001119EF97|nr:pseudouridine synthase [Raoultibacter phocaeensis]